MLGPIRTFLHIQGGPKIGPLKMMTQSIHRHARCFIWSKTDVLSFITVKYSLNCSRQAKVHHTEMAIHRLRVKATLCVIQQTEFHPSSV